MSNLDKLLHDAAAIARTIEPLVAFVAAAQAAVGIGGKNAATAIQVVDGALRALEGYASGQHTAEQATASMAKLLAALAADNADADAALAARFPDLVSP